LSNSSSKSGALSIGADHDLQRAVAVDAAKVKIALGGYVGDVCGNATLLAETPDNGGSGRVVDGHENHLGAVEVVGFEDTIDMCDLFLGDAESDLGVEARLGTDHDDAGVCVETVEDSTGSDLQGTVSC
jgi:hypothetical protein